MCGWSQLRSALAFSIHQRTMGPTCQTRNQKYGVSIISVDAQVNAPRGATKVFMDGLLGLLAQMVLGEDAVIVLHPDYLVARSDFPATDVGETAWSNQRQTLAGRLRSHHEELVRRGDLPAGTRLSINWAPDDGSDGANHPQCSLKRKA